MRVDVARCSPTLLTDEPLARVEADVLVVTVGGSREQLLPGAAAASLGPDLLQGLSRTGWVPSWGAQQHVTLPDGRAVLVVGTGPDAPTAGLPRVTLREHRHALAAGVAGLTAGTVAVSAAGVWDALLLEAVVLGSYRFDRYAERPRPAQLVVADLPALDEDAVAELASRLQSVVFARDWVNAGPSDKRPSASAALLVAEAERTGVEVRVWTTEELRAAGAGGVVAVGQGSAPEETARVVQLTARGTSDAPPLVLVGKGLTYDAGGVNLKTVWLEHMKLDMGGAAAVVGAVLHAGRRPRRRAVHGWVALAENLPSATSYLAGDVVSMHSGLSVEVVNTDAEGRLALADAMSLADAGGAGAVLTVATLTGHAIQSLGPRTAAFMTTDDGLARLVDDAAAAAGESVWRMPCLPYLADSLRSAVADTTNLGSLQGQAMVASAFLRRFAPEGVPYGHLDLAGPAFTMGEAHDGVPAGGTGWGVRTLVELADAL